MIEQQKEVFDFIQKLKAISSVDFVELIKAHIHNGHDFPKIKLGDTEGILPIANGGTGQVAASLAINALLPSQSGSSGEFLTTNGSVASWGTLSAAGVSFTAGEDISINASVSMGDGSTYTAAEFTTEPASFEQVSAAVETGQTFTTGSAPVVLKQVTIRVQDIVSSHTGTVNIYATSGGVPTGASLGGGSQTISGAFDYTFTILNGSDTVYLAASTMYAIVFTMNDASYRLYYVAAGGYSSGTRITKSSGTWATASGDCKFNVTGQYTSGQLFNSSAATNDFRVKNFIGFASAAITHATAGVVQHTGVLSGFTGLTVGQYYLSDTLGALSTTAGSVSRKSAIALSSTTLLITNIW